MSWSGDERRALGLSTMRAYQGADADAVLADIEEMAGDFVEFVLGGFADVYARPGLTPAERQLITIASLATLGADPQLERHLHAALRVGVSSRQLHEVFTQLSLYAGVPRALNGFRVLRDVLGDRATQS